MNKTECFLAVKNYIRIISHYLNQEDSSNFLFDDYLHLPFFFEISKRHSLTALFYKAFEYAEARQNEDFLRNLEQFYLSNVRKTILFDKERKALYEALRKNEINFLPLKGIVLKDYYPDQCVREFADNDILFDDRKAPIIKRFFVERGYIVESYKKTGHDVYIKKPFYNFEMHRSLFSITTEKEIIVDYFKDYLFKAPLIDNYEHCLNKEDFFIYFIAHSHNHYSHSGCGLRTLIDIFLYLKKENLDFTYVNRELNKIGLLDFCNKIVELSCAIFNNENLSDELEEMFLFIVSSGTYGTLEHAVNKGIEEKGKFGYLMSKLFPPYIYYKRNYPWAYYSFLLIPLAWAHRLAMIFFKHPKKASNEIKTMIRYNSSKTKE